jgi:hypothetical protein
LYEDLNYHCSTRHGVAPRLPASTAGIGLAAEGGVNVVREFAPRRNRHPPT